MPVGDARVDDGDADAGASRRANRGPRCADGLPRPLHRPEHASIEADAVHPGSRASAATLCRARRQLGCRRSRGAATGLEGCGWPRRGDPGLRRRMTREWPRGAVARWAQLVIELPAWFAGTAGTSGVTGEARPMPRRVTRQNHAVRPVGAFSQGVGPCPPEPDGPRRATQARASRGAIGCRVTSSKRKVIKTLQGDTYGRFSDLANTRIARLASRYVQYWNIGFENSPKSFLQ